MLRLLRTLLAGLALLWLARHLHNNKPQVA
jgi:hypothetical protein